MSAGSQIPTVRAFPRLSPAGRDRLIAFAGVARATAARHGPPPAPAEGFSDEMGHRRPVDAPFLAWRSGRPVGPRPTGGMPLDVALWRIAAGEAGDVRAILAGAAPGPGGFGALLDQGSVRTIEVWTETELSALHALCWIALRTGDAALAARTLDAARWHVAHMQPDNATNHPWGAHIFALLDVLDDRREPGLYAQTLIHNCQVHLGRPDRLSTVILLDCADAIDALVRGG